MLIFAVVSNLLMQTGTMPQFHVDKTFADRRYKVSSARTYFYLNEATCERNLEIFQQSLQAVAGKMKSLEIIVHDFLFFFHKKEMATRFLRIFY